MATQQIRIEYVDPQSENPRMIRVSDVDPDVDPMYWGVERYTIGTVTKHGGDVFVTATSGGDELTPSERVLIQVGRLGRGALGSLIADEN